MTPFVATVSTVSLGVLTGILWVLHRIPLVLEALREDYRSPGLVKMEARVTALEAERNLLKIEVERLPIIWKEETARAKRAAERARWHARQSADGELDEGDDGDEPAGGVRSGDAAPGGGGSVPPVPSGVGVGERATLSDVSRSLALSKLSGRLGHSGIR